MTTAAKRCPNCAGALSSPLPASCSWCGVALTDASAAGSAARNPERDAVLGLPRELPPLASAPRRGGIIGFVLLALILLAFAVVFLTVRSPVPVER